MTMRGRLDDVSLPDLLQLFSANRRTGKLTLSHRDGFASILFRDGRVIYAASNRTHETFGSILVNRGLVDEGTLLAALEAQNVAPEERRLGSILEEMGVLTEDDLRSVMRYQVSEVLRELLSWREAFFKFQPGTIPDRGEVGVDCQDLVLYEGLTAEGVLVDVVRRERDRRKKAAGPGSAIDPIGAAGGGDGDGDGRDASQQPISLTRAMTEVRSPSFTGEIALQILRFAGQVLGRGVLFGVGRELAHGIGQFGIEAEGSTAPDERVRGLKIPLDQPSVVAEAAAVQDTVRGPLERTPWNERLAEELGGVMPNEAVAIPLTVNGTTAFVLYGDDLPDRRPLGSMEPLEVLLIEAGLAIEKDALEQRVRQIESRRADA